MDEVLLKGGNMRCWRFQLRRSLSRYVHGELKPSRLRKVEEHLLDCGECRARLTRLQSAHRLADQLSGETPARDPWAAIEAAISRESAVQPAFEMRPLSFLTLLTLLRRHAPAVAVGSFLFLIVSVFLFLPRWGGSAGSLLAKKAIDLREFHQVSIADMEWTTKSHVMAEGYVSELRINDEDGDLSFKLVDDLGHSGPFIVCEIIDPIRIEAPSVGSRVRVYGVSRYDNQRNHNWYEVHPVLNIEVVRH